MKGFEDEEHRPTRRHLKSFKGLVEKWQGKFGLFDWDINVDRADLGEGCSAIAATFVDIEARLAEIMLNAKINAKPTHALLNQAAFHEVCEVLISELHDAVRNRKKISEDQLSGITHSLIRRLEHLCEVT